MHELGTIHYVIDTVEKLAVENELSKIASVTLEPEGDAEPRQLKPTKGAYAFPSCDGKLKIAYRLGGDAELEFVVYLEK